MSAGDPFAFVKEGDPISFSAGLHNAMVEVVQWFKRTRGQFVSGGEGDILYPGEVLVKNATAANQDRFAVFGVGDALIDNPSNNAESEASFKERIAIEVEVLEVPKHIERWVVLVEDLPENDFGRAVAFGAVPVKVWVRDENHRFAEVVDIADDGETPVTRFASDVAGSAHILWKESGITDDWAWSYIRFPCLNVPLIYQAVDQEDVADNTLDIRRTERSGAAVAPTYNVRTAGGH